MQSRADATAAGGGSDLHPERPPLAKDTASLGRALEKCRPYLLSVANDEIASDLTSKAGASDIVQDTMLEASRDIDQFDGQSEHELKGWLRRILRNNLANFVRSFKTSDKRRINLEVSLDRDGPNGRAEIDLAGSTLSPSGEAARREQLMLLELSLSRLPERYRLVLTLRHKEGLQWEAIGERIGGSGEMSRKVWTRAIERLRDEFGDPPNKLQDGSASG
jgi:RNA polymerase sigma-70 factor, ECF subfamily